MDKLATIHGREILWQVHAARDRVLPQQGCYLVVPLVHAFVKGTLERVPSSFAGFVFVDMINWRPVSEKAPWKFEYATRCTG
jgi:hypothetical protein